MAVFFQAPPFSLGCMQLPFFLSPCFRKKFILFSDWLKEGEDVPLKVTAALSMGNLCCSSKNCGELIGLFSPALIQALKVTYENYL